MNEQSWVQFPNFERAIEADETNRLGVERIAEPKAWLNDVQLGIIFEPFNNRTVIPAELIDEAQRTQWIGAFHAVREQVTPSFEYPLPPEVSKNRLFSLVLREHTYMWDGQADEGAASEAILLQKDSEDDEATPVAAILVKHRDNSVQQLVIKGEAGWEAPDESKQDMVGSYLYVIYRLAMQASPTKQVDNRGETS